jgi:Tol biopolymer transport system component
VIASRADGADGAPAGGFSADAAISPDGRWVAFTSDAGNLGATGGRMRLYLRDLDAGRTIAVPGGSGLPLDPVVSDGGTQVAFTAVRGSRAEVRVWSAATNAVTLVSRASGGDGAPADGWSDDPSMSADGTRIAFASTATNLDAKKRAPVPGVFVRDLATASTKLVSDPSIAYAVGR